MSFAAPEYHVNCRSRKKIKVEVRSVGHGDGLAGLQIKIHQIHHDSYTTS